MKNSRLYAHVFVALLLLLTACIKESPAPSPTPGAPTLTLTDTSQPTLTQQPTNTSQPTLQPTETPMNTLTPTPIPQTYRVVAYFPEWGYRLPYLVKNIETSGAANTVTVINYAFGLPAPDASGNVVCTIGNANAAYAQRYTAAMSIDGAADGATQPLRGHFNQLLKLKARHPQIKVVISLGGWSGSGWFSVAARTAESRQAFVSSCLSLFIQGNLPPRNHAGGAGAAAGVFDGFDIDWEYPVKGALPTNHYSPADAQNFVLLLQEFRSQFAALGRPDLLLTMAAPGPGQAGQYEIPNAHPLLDYIDLMTYDQRGAWSDGTGHHTNLCPSAHDPDAPRHRQSADRTVRLYRDTFGVPAEKLLVGSAFYGHGWSSVDATNNGLYRPGIALSESESSQSRYRDLVTLIGNGFTRFWDDTASAPWLYSPGQKTFWSYDDPQSLGLKAEYVRNYGLGGIMFWEISGDDAQGSLVSAIAGGLQATTPATDPCQGGQ
ncbi:MAG TPA: glycosyl hydrolase family 18 protein [Anaerolineaceae bacterium]